MDKMGSPVSDKETGETASIQNNKDKQTTQETQEMDTERKIIKPRGQVKRKLSHNIPMTEDILQRFAAGESPIIVSSFKGPGTSGESNTKTKTSKSSPDAKASSSSSPNEQFHENITQAKRQYTGIPDTLVKLTQNKYKSDNKGPFLVQLEGIPLPTPNTSDTLEQLGVIGLGRKLNQIPECIHFMKNAFDFKKVGANKFNIYFPKYNIANDFVKVIWMKKDSITLKHLWIASIPNFKLYKRVILRGIDDPEIDINIISENIRAPKNHLGSWRKPIEISRLTKKIFDKTDNQKFTIVSTQTVVATFDYSNLTTTANLFGKTIYLIPFIQTVQRCDHCQRFGHVRRLCRSGKSPPFCERCGREGHEAAICSDKTSGCINCIRQNLQITGHRASDPKCPIFIQQKEIKKVMAEFCLSPTEALKRLNDMGRGDVVEEASATYTQNNISIPHPLISDFLPPRFMHGTSLNRDGFPPLNTKSYVTSKNSQQLSISEGTNSPQESSPSYASILKTSSTSTSPSLPSPSSPSSPLAPYPFYKKRIKNNSGTLSTHIAQSPSQKSLTPTHTFNPGSSPKNKNNSTNYKNQYSSGLNTSMAAPSPTSPSRNQFIFESPLITSSDSPLPPALVTSDHRGALFEEFSKFLLNYKDLFQPLSINKNIENSTSPITLQHSENSEYDNTQLKELVSGLINIVFKSILV